MDRGSQNGYMAVELVERLVEDGLASVKEAYPEGPKLEGAIEGFEIARTLCATYEDFDWAVTQRQEAEEKIRQGTTGDEDTDSYWRHRWATLQLEYCRDILLVAKHASGVELPAGTILSARAVIRYADIVGVEEK